LFSLFCFKELLEWLPVISFSLLNGPAALVNLEQLKRTSLQRFFFT